MLLTDYDTVHITRGRGSISLLRSFGRDNAVSWDLLENPTTKTGVVTSLQGAILSKRRTMDPLKATITLSARLDTFTTINTLFKKDPKDDDVWYDPKEAPTNSLNQYDIDNLGTLDLKSLSDVTFHTLLMDTVKEERIHG